MSPLLEAARQALTRGWQPTPLHRLGGGKYCSCHKGANCNQGGKHPRLKEWQSAPPMSGADIEATWDVDQPPNLAIRTGRVSGIVVIDVDTDDGKVGLDWLNVMIAEHGRDWTQTYTVRTGGGGYQMYFTYPAADIPGRLNFAPNIDVKSDGGYVIAPPSVSHKGPYSVQQDLPVAPMPTWLVEALSTPSERPERPTTGTPAGPLDEREQAWLRGGLKNELARLDALRASAVPAGQTYHGEPWNETCFKVACNLIEIANSGLAEDVWLQFLEHAPQDPGFDASDLELVWKSAMKTIGTSARAVPPPVVASDDPLSPNYTPATAPRPVAAEAPAWGKRGWNDVGNAERIVALQGEVLRWVPSAKTWARYDGGRWVMSEDGGELAALGTVRRLWDLEAGLYAAEPAGEAKKSQRELFSEWLDKQHSARALSAAARVTRISGKLNAEEKDFNAHPMLLNAPNGVVNLATGQLEPHDPSLLLSLRTRVEFDAAARAPRWLRFLEEVVPDLEMRNYLQRIVGYTITGSTDEQAMFVHHGVTKNGKSVFLKVMEAMLGDYSQVVPPTTLLTKRNEQHPAEIARMKGKRMLQMSETPNGARLDEALIKRLTGQESISGRLMNENWSEFRIDGKIHLVTNHLPHIGSDPATHRRLHTFNWSVTVPEDRRDAGLADRMIANELPGVLNWAVQGALEWQKHRLSPPAAAQMDADDYFSSEDEFGEWLEERTMKSSSAWTKTDRLYLNYNEWCKSMNQKAMSKIAFSRELSRRGFERKRDRSAKGYALVLTMDAAAADPLA